MMDSTIMRQKNKPPALLSESSHPGRSENSPAQCPHMHTLMSRMIPCTMGLEIAEQSRRTNRVTFSLYSSQARDEDNIKGYDQVVFNFHSKSSPHLPHSFQLRNFSVLQLLLMRVEQSKQFNAIMPGQALRGVFTLCSHRKLSSPEDPTIGFT